MTVSEAAVPPVRRALQVGVAVALSASVVGFFAGIRPDEVPAAVALSRASPAAAGAVRPAPSYTDLRTRPARAPDPATAGVPAIEAQAFPAAPLPLPPQVLDPQPDRRAEAVALRAKLRAYDGAPPVVPHPVRQQGDLDCAACHVQGIAIGGRQLPRISHGFLTNCTQCHVPADGALPPGMASPEQVAGADGNTFVGSVGPVLGQRAWPGAPPTIPPGRAASRGASMDTR